MSKQSNFVIVLIFAMGFIGFASHSAPFIQKRLVDYLSQHYRSGGCACSTGESIFYSASNALVTREFFAADKDYETYCRYGGAIDSATSGGNCSPPVPLAK